MKNIFDIEDDLSLNVDSNDYLINNHKIHLIVSNIFPKNISSFKDRIEMIFADSSIKNYIILDSNFIEITSDWTFDEKQKTKTHFHIFTDSYIDNFKHVKLLLKLKNQYNAIMTVITDDLNSTGYNRIEDKFIGDSHEMTVSMHLMDETGFTDILYNEVVNQAKQRSICLDLRDIDVSKYKLINFCVFYTDKRFYQYKKTFNEIDITGWDTSNLQYLSFDNMFSIENIIGIEDIDTSNITSMNRMFYGCEHLKSLDLSKWNTSKVTDMSEMFTRNQHLEVFENNFDTSKVTDMSHMFSNCHALKKIDTSGWKVKHVTNISNIFSNCRSVEELDVFFWNVSKVKDFFSAFSDCYSLKSLDISIWNMSNAKDLSYMFSDCSKLTELDVSRWDVSNVENMMYLFSDCSRLTKLDVSKWDTSNCCDMLFLFADCSSLTELDVSRWNVRKVYNMSHMFCNCSSLNQIVTKYWKTDSLQYKDDMFTGCKKFYAKI